MSVLATTDATADQAGFSSTACASNCRAAISSCSSIKQCRFAMDIDKETRDAQFFGTPFVQPLVDCLERHCLADTFQLDGGDTVGDLVKREVGCGNRFLPYYNVHDVNGKCSQGFKCKDGEDLLGLVVCDFQNDCIDSTDETNTFCATLLQQSEFQASQAAAAEIPWYEQLNLNAEEQAEYEARESALAKFSSGALGSGARSLVAAFIVVTLAGIALLAYSRRSESRKFDATNSSKGDVPYWAHTDRRRGVAKAWNIVWEFKATPVIAYSFYTMVITTVIALNSQQLENSCLQDLSMPVVWNVSECDVVNEPAMGCRKYAGKCDSEEPAPRIFPFEQNMCEIELRGNKKTNLLRYMKDSDIRSDPSRLECKCENVEETAKAAKQYALPLSVVSSFGLAALVLCVIMAPGVMSSRFGTLDYFVAVSNSKRRQSYVVILCINMLILACAVVALMFEIEVRRREIAGTTKKSANPNQINENQYSNVYAQIVADCLLQMMAYTDLWARIPPSNALAYFKDQFEPASSQSDVNKDIPKTIGGMDGSWSWFMTAEDTLEIAEDGFLFYYFSTHLPTYIDSTGEVHTLIRSVKTSASGDHEHEEGTRPSSRPKELGTVHEAYMAQRLSQQYWKGGVSFKPAPEARRKYSIDPAANLGIRTAQIRETVLNSMSTAPQVPGGNVDDEIEVLTAELTAASAELAAATAELAEKQVRLDALKRTKKGNQKTKGKEKTTEKKEQTTKKEKTPQKNAPSKPTTGAGKSNGRDSVGRQCAHSSEASGKQCVKLALASSDRCTHHTCTTGGCSNAKLSSEEHCRKHAKTKPVQATKRAGGTGSGRTGLLQLQPAEDFAGFEEDGISAWVDL